MTPAERLKRGAQTESSRAKLSRSTHVSNVNLGHQAAMRQLEREKDARIAELKAALRECVESRRLRLSKDYGTMREELANKKAEALLGGKRA